MPGGPELDSLLQAFSPSLHFASFLLSIYLIPSPTRTCHGATSLLLRSFQIPPFPNYPSMILSFPFAVSLPYSRRRRRRKKKKTEPDYHSPRRDISAAGRKIPHKNLTTFRWVWDGDGGLRDGGFNARYAITSFLFLVGFFSLLLYPTRRLLPSVGPGWMGDQGREMERVETTGWDGACARDRQGGIVQVHSFLGC